MAHTDNVCYIQAGNGTGTTGSSNDVFIGNYGQTTTTSTRKFIIKGTTGNVGIGTNNPTSILDVNGTVNISNTLTLNNNLILPQTQSIGFYRDISTLDMNSYIAPESGNSANLTLYSLRGNGSVKILANGGASLPIFLVNSTSTTTPSTTDLFRILGNGNVGIGTNNPTSTLTVNGSLAKTSGTFDIEHPIDNTKRLVHSFIEGPRCDLIYRGSIQLINGKATIDLDKDCVEDSKNGMSSGTFMALVQNPVCYLQNSTFDRVIGTITNNLLNIVCENNTSSSIVNWMVIGERKDNGIKQWDRTDSLGRLITEYKK